MVMPELDHSFHPDVVKIDGLYGGREGDLDVVCLNVVSRQVRWWDSTLASEDLFQLVERRPAGCMVSTAIVGQWSKYAMTRYGFGDGAHVD
jgi:hypothetical protein